MTIKEQARILSRFEMLGIHEILNEKKDNL